MNLREFLSDSAIRLPRLRGTDDFQGFVSEMLDGYLAKLDQFTQPTDLAAEVQSQRENIVAFCNAAKELVLATLAGHPHTAYSLFLEGIEPLASYVQRQALKELKTTDLGILYRVRKQLGATLTREGLFHIPFEARHRVSTQRYSIPGLPCLYLGGSLYTCWAEMGRPPFNELHASAFWLSNEKTVSILNLAGRPARLLLLLTSDGEPPPDPHLRNALATEVILWPLQALCSIVVRHRDAPFKPEYILPQILLQWVSQEHQFDGICYYSTHVEAVTNLAWPPCNLVFPARKIKPTGRCARLRQLFKMTEPLPWDLLRALNMGSAAGPYAVPAFNFEFIHGYKEPYFNTEFGDVQWKLNKLAVDTITLNLSGTPDLGTVAE